MTMGKHEEFPDEAFAPQESIGTDPFEDRGIEVSQTTEVIK